MNEFSIPTFEKAILTTYGAKARLQSRVAVKEVCGVWYRSRGRRCSYETNVWEGEVLVFELESHATAPKCYAWSFDGRVIAVLHEGLIDSPEAAARATNPSVHLVATKHCCRPDGVTPPHLRTTRRRR